MIRKLRTDLVARRLRRCGRVSLTLSLCVHARVFLHRHENFEGYFRRQFTRRVPYKQNPLGHEDEPVHWEDVDMMDKLDVLFHLCEWQFSGAGRLRAMMGEVDELAWVSLRSGLLVFIALF